MVSSLHTNVAAKEIGYGVVQCLRKKITYLDYATTVTVGKIPAYSSVIYGGVHVVTAFNSSGTDLLNVGFIGGTTDADAYMTIVSLAAVGFLALDELAATTNIMQTVDTTVTAAPAQSVADATAGEAYVIVMFVTGYPQT